MTLKCLFRSSVHLQKARTTGGGVPGRALCFARNPSRPFLHRVAFALSPSICGDASPRRQETDTPTRAASPSVLESFGT